MATSKVKVKNSGFKVTLFVLLFIIVGGTAGCLFAPVFNITNIKAEDGANVTSGEILNAANIPIGVNIFKINDTKVLKNVKNIPYVREANLYRMFPNTIVLKVEEREQYAIVKYLESFAIVDKYGYILEIKKTNDLKDLPIIYGLDNGKFVVGNKLEGTSLIKYENCAYLIETANKTGFNYKFSEINYDDSTNVKLCIADKDIDVVYGNVYIDDIEEKLGHLDSILENLKNKKGKIDMSDENYLAKTVFTEKK